ncbi:MAG: PAS domain S-box-containing protein [Candidatus Azotimanducaceae bacterium]|jgi:PAS domain S-box-containing protein
MRIENIDENKVVPAALISQMAAQEIFKRTVYSPFVYSLMFAIFILSTSIYVDHPQLSFLSFSLLLFLGTIRSITARKFSAPNTNYKKFMIQWYILLIALHHTAYSIPISVAIIHYGHSFETGLLALFVLVAAASVTNTLSIRKDVHIVTLVCSLLPPVIAIYFFAGLDQSYLVFMLIGYVAFLFHIAHEVRKSFYEDSFTQLNLAESNRRLSSLNNELDQSIIKEKGAQEKQVKAETNLLDFFEQSLDPIIIIRDWNIIYINKSATVFFNRDKNALLAHSIKELIQPSFLQKISTFHTRSDPTQIPIMELGFIKLDGTVVYGDTRWTPLIFEGKPSTLVDVRDLTLQNLNEAATRKSEREFKLLAENNPYPIVVLSGGKFLYTNAAAQNLTGYSLDELLAIPVENLLHPEDLPILAERRSAINREEEPITEELRLLRKDGSTLTVLINTSSGSFSDNEKAHIIHVHDMTAIRLTETQKKGADLKVQQSQKLEAIGTLAGGIAHDFNNMLTVIAGYTELALSDVEEGSEIDDYLKSILFASEKARKLVDQILSFGRQDQEKKSFMDMESCLLSTLTLLRQSLPTSINIKTNFNTQTSTIFSNEVQIQQIIINLIMNAADAIGVKQGIIELSLDDCEINNSEHPTLSSGSYLKLCIQDNGAGMEPEVLESAFEPFYTTKNKGEGTGLGLFLVYSLIEAHGAVLDVQSNVGEGTRFTIYYPKHEIQVLEPSNVATSFRKGEERIMVVDDNKMVLDVVSKSLSRLGHQISAYTNGIEALVAFRTNPNGYDLVISDVQMPRMTGKTLAKEILHIRCNQNIILCSGYSEIIEEEEAIAMGVKAYLPKPVSLQTLSSTLHQIFDEGAM